MHVFVTYSKTNIFYIWTSCNVNAGIYFNSNTRCVCTSQTIQIFYMGTSHLHFFVCLVLQKVGWLVVGCLTSSGKYFMHIQDENKFTTNTIGRSFQNRDNKGLILLKRRVSSTAQYFCLFLLPCITYFFYQTSRSPFYE